MLRLATALWLGLVAAPSEAPDDAPADAPADEVDDVAPEEGEAEPAESLPDVSDPELPPSIRVLGAEEAAALGIVPGEPAPARERAQRKPRVYRDAPIRVRFELAAAFASTIPHDDSYLAFDENRSRHGADVGLRLDFPVGKWAFIGPVIGYRHSRSRGEIFNRIHRTALVMHEPTVGVRLALRPLDFLDVYAQVSGGPIVSDLEMEWSAGSGDQRAVTGGGTALLGSMLYFPKRALPRRGSSRATTGIDLGVGYALRAPVEVELERALDDDPIDTEGTSLGDLRTSGVTWRIGFFVRFN